MWRASRIQENQLSVGAVSRTPMGELTDPVACGEGQTAPSSRSPTARYRSFVPRTLVLRP